MSKREGVLYEAGTVSPSRAHAFRFSVRSVLLLFLVFCVVMFVCFLFVFLLLSDVPIVASVSGLSIRYYPSFIYTCLNLFSCLMVLNVTFNSISSYIVAVSFIGGGNRRTRKKPPTCRKSLTNFIT